jgi:hypothetical protein
VPARPWKIPRAHFRPLPLPILSRRYGAPSAAQQAEALRSSVAAQFSEPVGPGSPTSASAGGAPPPPAGEALNAAAAAAGGPGDRPAGGSESSDSSGEEDDDDAGERFKLGPDGPLQGAVAPGSGGAAALATGRGAGPRPHHHHHHEGLLLKDAFLVFRALCKLSTRTSDSATVQDPTAVRGKVRGASGGAARGARPVWCRLCRCRRLAWHTLPPYPSLPTPPRAAPPQLLALELLKVLLENSGPRFRSSERFISAIRQVGRWGRGLHAGRPWARGGPCGRHGVRSAGGTVRDQPPRALPPLRPDRPPSACPLRRRSTCA